MFESVLTVTHIILVSVQLLQHFRWSKPLFTLVLLYQPLDLFCQFADSRISSIGQTELIPAASAGSSL